MSKGEDSLKSPSRYKVRTKASSLVCSIAITLLAVAALALTPGTARADDEDDSGYYITLALDDYSITPSDTQKVEGTVTLVYWNKNLENNDEEDDGTSGGNHSFDLNSLPSSYELTVTLTRADGTAVSQTVKSGKKVSFDLIPSDVGTVVNLTATGGPEGDTSPTWAEVDVLSSEE